MTRSHTKIFLEGFSLMIIKNTNDPIELGMHLRECIKSYNKLAKKFSELYEDMIHELSLKECYRLELKDRDETIQKLSQEIVNLYRELGETKGIENLEIDKYMKSPKNSKQLRLFK